MSSLPTNDLTCPLDFDWDTEREAEQKEQEEQANAKSLDKTTMIDQDEIDLDNVDAIIITDEQEQKKKPTPKKHTCYSNSHYMSYVIKYRLQYNAYNTYDYYNAIVRVLKRIKHGGYNNNVYIKFNPETNTTPLAINNIRCVGGCLDNNNGNFTHNFVEIHYYGDKQYNNLVDIITPREFIKEFNGLIIKYNATIHKGLHYVNDEIDKLKQYAKFSTRAK